MPLLMLATLPRMPFLLLLVYHLPLFQEEDQAPPLLPDSCPVRSIVILAPLRPLPTASLLIPTGFCCYCPFLRRPLPSPIQLHKSQSCPSLSPPTPSLGELSASCPQSHHPALCIAPLQEELPYSGAPDIRRKFPGTLDMPLLALSPAGPK